MPTRPFPPEKRRAIAKYIRDHPDHSFTDAAVAFGVSRSTVSNIAREFNTPHLKPVVTPRPITIVKRSDRRVGDFLRFLSSVDAVRMGAQLRIVDARMHEHFARAFIKCPHNGQEGANHSHE